jgi:hypothetical protein
MSYDPAHNRYDCRVLSQKCHGLSSFEECHQTSVVFQKCHGLSSFRECHPISAIILEMSWPIIVVY